MIVCNRDCIFIQTVIVNLYGKKSQVFVCFLIQTPEDGSVSPGPGKRVYTFWGACWSRWGSAVDDVREKAGPLGRFRCLEGSGVGGRYANNMQRTTKPVSTWAPTLGPSSPVLLRDSVGHFSPVPREACPGLIFCEQVGVLGSVPVQGGWPRILPWVIGRGTVGNNQMAKVTAGRRP